MVDVNITLKRKGSLFELDFTLNGEVFVPCDRCLDDITMDVDTKNRLIVKFGKEYSEESDEIVIIPEEDGEINIVWFLYEFIALSLPMKKVHPQGECNKAMSSKLKKYKTVDPEDGDAEDTDDDLEDDSEPDPRWDSLKGVNIDED